ncbi:MAG TPA: peroxiredoxin [Acidimicrobiales bacterium]|jgi:peroxiredoxin|nr:peroxiredoxin [Acidimicrobiales bacterium]
MVEVGDRIPDVRVMTNGSEGIKPAQSGELLGTGRVVLFAVPGAFTPGCSDYHLPGFVTRAADIKAKGVDTIACIAVNDAFVMGAWGKAQNVGDDILMLADGNGDFAKAMGLEMDGTGFGLGIRSQRYAAIIDDGVLTALLVEQGPGVNTSSANAVIDAL